jgi:hypothetical protein
MSGPDAVRTTIVGGRPPGNGTIPRHIPRGLEVLIKKAAVDPGFKDILFEKRAGAAEAIGLKLTAAEEAILAAVPLPHLEGIIAHTRVSPKLKPVFLGYAAAAMFAALAASAPAHGCDDIECKTYGIATEIPPETAATPDVPDSPGKTARDDKSDYGKVSGTVSDNKGNPLSDVMVSVVGTNRFAVTNAEGYYLITPVPTGIITVEAFSTVYGSVERNEVKILPGLTTSLTFQYINPPLETPAEPRIKYNQVYQGIRPDRP